MTAPAVQAPVTCLVLGAGGHASVLIECLELRPATTIAGVLDPDRRLWGGTLLGVPVLGGDDRLDGLAASGVTHFVVGVGGIGNNRPRQRLYEAALAAGLAPLVVRHPSSVVSSRAVIGAGSQLLPGCIVHTLASLGVNVIVNSGAIVEHNCVVADHAHVATGARLASTVRVGVGAHIGTGATILQCLRIGDWAVVGAGAVVIRDVPAGATVVGVPARVIEAGATGPRG